jgi:deazaflavin-dependent oxidoreductase (nitroreductase family)
MNGPRRFALRVMWTLHRAWFRVSGGRLGTQVAGLPVLELTTTGRNSGRPRRVLLTYVLDPLGFVVIASNAGAERDPAWWLNLQAHPNATTREGRVTHAVRMRRLEGEERERAWRRAVDAFGGYARYETMTARSIPVALLEKMPGEPPAA